MPNTDKLIRASDARRAILREAPAAAYCLDRVKPVDAVEVVHGYWKPTGDPILDNIYGVAECSICGYEYAGNNTNYCPDCGAKMDGDKR